MKKNNQTDNKLKKPGNIVDQDIHNEAGGIKHQKDAITR